MCLLHNGNKYASVPIAHATTLKEKYEAIKYVLENISYDQHGWLICVDLKIVNFLLGQQLGLQSIHAFSACGAAGIELSITQRETGQQGMI